MPTNNTKRNRGPEPKQKAIQSARPPNRSRLSLPHIFSSFALGPVTAVQRCNYFFSAVSSPKQFFQQQDTIAKTTSSTSPLSATISTMSSQPAHRNKSPLDLPELLTLTFQFLAHDNALYPALLVNRQWHACASRILWRRVTFEAKDANTEQLVRFQRFAESFGGWQREADLAASMSSNGAPTTTTTTTTVQGNVSGAHATNQNGPAQRGSPTVTQSASQTGRVTKADGSSHGNVDLVQRFNRTASAPAVPNHHRRTQSMVRLPKSSNVSAGYPTRLRAASTPTPLFSRISPNSSRLKLPHTSDEVVDMDDLTISSDPSCTDPSSAPTPTDIRTLPSLLQTYRSHLHALSLRKVKDKTINEPLLAIAEHARNLTSLDIYICDHLMETTVLAFINIHHPISPITHLSLAGCHRITDTVVLSVAAHCPNLHYLDLRACGLVSDASITAIAHACPQLHHLNVGRIRERDRITTASILPLARLTQITVLGLAGCDITDECMLSLSEHRGEALERISVNNCPRITDRSIRAFVDKCKKLSVLELKECIHVGDWEAIDELVQRKVLLTLCERQKGAWTKWARIRGRPIKVRAPVK